MENTIVVYEHPLRAVTKVRAWNKDHKVYTNIYYSAKKASGIREDLCAKVALLKQKATTWPEKCRKYLLSESQKRRPPVVPAASAGMNWKKPYTAGWVVLISNDIPDAPQTMCVYRNKDVVGKSFLRLKNSIDLGQLHVHSDNAMHGKLFVGFLVSILMAKLRA